MARLKARFAAKSYAQDLSGGLFGYFLPRSSAHTLSVCLFPWMLLSIGFYISWISRILSIMAISMKRCAWSNHLGLFVAQRGSMGKFVIRENLYNGLKQSPCTWFGKFGDVVHKFGLKKRKCDPQSSTDSQRLVSDWYYSSNGLC